LILVATKRECGCATALSSILLNERVYEREGSRSQTCTRRVQTCTRCRGRFANARAGDGAPFTVSVNRPSLPQLSLLVSSPAAQQLATDRERERGKRSG
jgi:hypothetical protein